MAEKKTVVEKPCLIAEAMERRGLGALLDIYRDIRAAFGERVTVTTAEVEAAEPEQFDLFSAPPPSAQPSSSGRSGKGKR